MELEALASQAVLTHDGQVARAQDDAIIQSKYQIAVLNENY